MENKLINCAEFIPNKVIKWFESEERDQKSSLIKYKTKKGLIGYICISYIGDNTFRASHQGEDIGYLEACGMLKHYDRLILDCNV